MEQLIRAQEDPGLTKPESYAILSCWQHTVPSQSNAQHSQESTEERNVKLPTITCRVYPEHCWIPRVANPTRCPRCKNIITLPKKRGVK